MKVSLSLSKTQIKKRAVNIFFQQTRALPHRDGGDSPVAIIMAGVPGSGKTEFIDSLLREIPILGDDALRIDLDEIVKVFEEYTPQKDYKFRNVGNAIIEGILDRAIHDRYNYILDGTFGGAAAVKNIERSIAKGYKITLFIMVEEIERAKQYTRIREKNTSRGVRDDAFPLTVRGIRHNVRKLLELQLPVDIVVIKKDWTDERVIYSIERDADVDRLYIE